jgi:hypothetical protein
LGCLREAHGGGRLRRSRGTGYLSTSNGSTTDPASSNSAIAKSPNAYRPAVRSRVWDRNADGSSRRSSLSTRGAERPLQGSSPSETSGSGGR